MLGGASGEEEWSTGWYAVAGWSGDRSQALACSDKVKLDGPGFLIDRGMILGGSSSREKTGIW